MLKARKLMICIGALALVAAAQPAPDGVQAGIAAWQSGNYEQAVAAWRPLADGGNADAQFNLGQAHRLGRGVPQDLRQAEQWFERAARQRHEQAGTNLGLLLFQNGRAREAMPWIQAAALRGDPRAQYVFGTALFNGDIVRRDLPRAYAMMSAAAGQSFPQADAQLREMDRHMTAADRERGRVLASEMGAAPAPASPQRPQLAEVRPLAPRPGAGVSFPIPAEAAPAIQPERPASRARPETRPAATAARPETPAQRPAAPAVRPTPERRAEAPAPQPAAGGRWRVQLGAFSNEANARRQWDTISRRVGALASLEPAYTRAGAFTRLRAGPLSDRGSADRVCAAVRSAGQNCLTISQ